MVNAPLPKINEMEYISISMINPGDKGVSMVNFLRYTTKSKELLKLLSAYDMITKDDIRPSFCGPSEDLPDCDSDLENEVYLKGNEKLTVNYDLLEHPFINAIFIIKI